MTAVLAVVFVWCLFAGRIPAGPLFLLGILVGGLLAVLGRHQHTFVISIDVYAQRSRLRRVNAALKFWTLFALIIVSVASQGWITGVFLMVAALLLAVCAGGLKLHDYVQIMALPVAFMLIGGVALLFDIRPEPAGVLSFNLFGLWLCVSESAQSQTALVISRAFGAVSCLTLLSMTTPMPEMISVLRRARCPGFIIDLMYLIYRYIFILLRLHHDMLDAAKSRLGFGDYQSSLRATGKIYANLFARSYQFASRNFDAMESRCFDTGIRFLERPHAITLPHAAAAAVFLLAAIGLAVWS